MNSKDADRIGFVLIGGEHQLLHIVPVAAALSRQRSVQVVLYATPAVATEATDIMGSLGSGPYELVVMRLPALLESLARARLRGVNMKLARLLRYAGELRDCTALVTAERTSSALRRLPGRRPMMIHLRHGAGDRAVGFEKRISLFDHLIVAGEKDRRRVVQDGLLPPDRCHPCGYIKMSALQRLRPQVPRLFDNDLPTVLYNPHFDPRLASWQRHGREVIERLTDDARFNVIVAPHVRLFTTQPRPVWREWERMAVPGRVLIDLGSPRSSDMTYTRTADLYLGDVSSQIYEFVARPRPCVFLDSHHRAWQGDPNYRMWEMGEVVTRPADIVAGLLRATERHEERYREVQQQRVAETLGDTGPQCAERAAGVIRESLVHRHLLDGALTG